jgi:hypothetical protein
MQVAYSNGLKHVLFIDVMIIAAGFTMRAYAGIVAIDVRVSPVAAALHVAAGAPARPRQAPRGRRSRSAGSPTRTGPCSTSTPWTCSTSSSAS